MADINIDPFGDHESRTEEPMGEGIPLIPTEEGVPTWNPGREQDTSFGGTSQRIILMKYHVEDLYKKLSEKYERTSEVPYFDDFELRDGELYYKDKKEMKLLPLTYDRGTLRTVKEIKDIGCKKA